MKRSYFFSHFVPGFLALYIIAYLTPVRANEVLMVTWQGKLSSEEAFEARLKELRPGVKFTYIDAKREAKTLESVLAQTDLSKYNLVYSFGTTGTRIVKKHVKGRKPQVFNIVSAPVFSKIAKSLKAPGNNLTGARLLVDTETQLDVLSRIKNYKTLAVWYDPREAQSKITLAKIQKRLKKEKRQVKAFALNPEDKNFESTLAKASEITNKQDALYIIASYGFLDRNRKMQKKLAPELLVMASISTFVETGSTIAVGVEFEELGRSVAEQAHKILGGAKAGSIPISVVTQKNATLYVNKEKMPHAALNDLDKLGMSVRLMGQSED